MTGLSKKDNLLINLLFLSAMLVFINLGPVSISFPIGVFALLFFSRRFRLRLFSGSIVWLTIMFATGVLSCMISEIPFEQDIYFLIQFFYWLLLTAMIGQMYPYIDKNALCKTIATGSLILGFVFLFLRLGSQNSVAFCLVVFSPLGIFGLKKRLFRVFYALLIIFIMFFNESRSGMAILSVEMLFIFAKLYNIKNLRIIATGITLLFTVLFMTPLHTILGNAISPFNEEVGMLLSDPDAVMYSDKSWIQRRVQQQKGLQIFKEHPVIGIGPSNFSKLNINIDVSGIENVDIKALNTAIKKSDSRSAHNSYILMLSEFGLVGTISWAFFLIAFLRIAIRNSKRFDGFEFALFVCVVGMSVYFYTISAFYGTFAWLFYGLMYGYTRQYKKTKI